ncbi:hypothetical protein BCR34DRAFT_579839 [Clohesyomyces aquaticus]|uniref:Uncharacterized protein n=1 Tax=Clohesyomyces aquaticus TaxID=1231657 RepID=A0A1Y1Y9E8_9PLEO|nr:hypothetical protein BCR34DRAFT_579839 [Clohesyomyces aquaticus]
MEDDLVLIGEERSMTLVSSPPSEQAERIQDRKSSNPTERVKETPSCQPPPPNAHDTDKYPTLQAATDYKLAFRCNQQQCLQPGHLRSSELERNPPSNQCCICFPNSRCQIPQVASCIHKSPPPNEPLWSFPQPPCDPEPLCPLNQYPSNFNESSAPPPPPPPVSAANDQI